MKRRISLIYRIVLIICGIYGLYLNFTGLNGNAYKLLHYFTILSNVLVVLFFIFLIVNHYRNKEYLHIKGAITMSITITFLVFHFMLRPTMFNMIGTDYSPYSAANLLLHYVVPLMTILDWILFDTKGEYKAYDPLLWLIIPTAYYVFSTINGIFGYTFINGSHYPYFFIDYDSLGLLGVLRYVLLILVAFIILGYIYYIIDRMLSKKIV